MGIQEEGTSSQALDNDVVPQNHMTENPNHSQKIEETVLFPQHHKYYIIK